MSSSKTFRLFVSSTFSDFSVERQVLQTKVFPRLKEYCLESGGYSFQPIDLRWGVGQEAQLDQKTLELCLNEVRTCKIHPAPNFIILCGDRYGWVPLPEAISAAELDALTPFLNDTSITKLLEWYKKDENQIPAAYILRPRTGDYVHYDQWENIETELRRLLQDAVKQSDLSTKEKGKYFLSATEAEVIEGILGYSIEQNEFHTRLRTEHGLQPEKDRENIWAFIRSIKGPIQGTLYSDNKLNELDRFKSRLRERIPAVSEAEPIINSSGALETAYLKRFERECLNFLTKRIDCFIEMQEAVPPLEIELEGHKSFKQQKLHLFQGQARARNLAQDYINGVHSDDLADPSCPLVFWGPSGRGKSTLMAKIIEEAQNQPETKIVYRFIGATPDSTSIITIFKGIFEQLGLDNSFFFDQDEVEGGSGSVEDILFRLRQELCHFDQLPCKLVIIIDSLDQLGHDEDFVWLPNELPDNVKMILSALYDENYPDANSCIQALNKRSVNFYEVPLPDTPDELLTAFLADKSRVLQKNQIDALLLNTRNPSPLYLYSAALQLQYVKSFDPVTSMPESQRDVIQNYIHQLHELHYHNRKLIERVLSYIHISSTGLSEREILQLLVCEPDLIEELAPETWHENPGGELPIVIWSRLYSQLKPFLKMSTYNGEDLISFFHREFGTVVQEMPVLQQNYRKFIKACQHRIKEQQNKPYYMNRWGDLYRLAVVNCHHLFTDDSLMESDFQFIAELSNKDWIRDFYDLFAAESLTALDYNNAGDAEIYWKAQLVLSRFLYRKDAAFTGNYTNTLNKLSQLNESLGHLDRARQYSEQAVEIAETAFKANPENNELARGYCNSLDYLGSVYHSDNQYQEAIELGERVLTVRREYYKKSPEEFLASVATALNNLAHRYSGHGHCGKAQGYAEEACEIRKTMYQDSPAQYADLYLTSLHLLANVYGNLNMGSDELQCRTEAVEILNELYEKNPRRWARVLALNLHDYGNILKDLDCYDDAVNALGKAAFIRQELYDLEPAYFSHAFVNTLNSLSWAYVSVLEMDKAIQCAEMAYPIAKEGYGQNRSRWSDLYCVVLSSLSRFLQSKGDLEKAIEYMEESVQVSEYFMEESIYEHQALYANSLRGLSALYRDTESFNKALEYAAQDLEIVRQLYTREPKRWLEDVNESFINSFRIYDSIKKYDKALECLNLARHFLEQGYSDSPDIWLTDYIDNLTLTVKILTSLERREDAVSTIERAIDLARQPYLDNAFPSMTFSNLLLEHYRLLAVADYGNLMKELCLEALEIQEGGYNESPEKWSGLYASGLNSLSYLFLATRRFSEAMEYLERGIIVCAEMYSQNPDPWLEIYLWFLHSMGTVFIESGDTKQGMNYA